LFSSCTIKKENFSIRGKRRLCKYGSITCKQIQERTFETISQEIHDNIGQLLSLAKLNLNTTDVNTPSIAQEKIEHSKELISKSITALRDLSKSLNSELIKEIGLSKSIQRELSLLSRSGQYHTSFIEKGTPYQLSKQKELVLFRIFQETLNNIIKHSNARTVNVQMKYENKSFELAIADDGVGFSLPTPGNGLGIRNMQNRACLIGAELEFRSAVGQGTVISIVLPAESA
jgi:signal transduction histidine kinase